jgi:Uma2 family endonuclease
MNAITPLKLSKAEFCRWLDGQPQEQRYELVNGLPRMMTRVKRAHDKVVANWIYALQRQLDRERFLVHTGDFAVSTTELTYRLPDVSVEAFNNDELGLELVEPLLLVEVLSTSTSYTDQNEKRDEYLALASLKAYIICAQDSRRVWAYIRDAQGQWPNKPNELTAPEEQLVIETLGLSIPLADLYFGVTVDNP